jgi:glucose/mannose transport system substrate-binding protein
VKKTVLAIALAGLAGMPFASAQQKQVQVIHWWTSGGEAAALQVLKNDLQSQGVQWHDVPIAGGGGAQAMTTLRARVLAGDPPTASQMLGFDITDWAKQGVLKNLNDLAKKGDWANKVPKALQAFDVYKGNWIAAPIDVHSTNWVWANKAVLAKAGVTSAPTTWDQYIADLEKVKKAGFIGLAVGGQSWQEATMFDGVVVSTGGPEFYKKAFIDLDQKALNSPTMLKAFERMSELHKFVDPNYANRDWNVATGMVINEKAGFQMMGDWALGEFNHAKKVPNKDFLCFRTPGTQGTVTYNSDVFVFFNVKDTAAQDQMAEDIMSPKVQAGFNQLKGAAPAELGTPSAGFNACGQKAISDLAYADKHGTLFGSMSQGYAVPPAIKNAFYDVIAREFNGEITPQAAVKQLADAAKAQY